jgi:hypothetical protein
LFVLEAFDAMSQRLNSVRAELLNIPNSDACFWSNILTQWNCFVLLIMKKQVKSLRLCLICIAFLSFCVERFISETLVQLFLLLLFLVGCYNCLLSSPCNKMEGAALICEW